MDLQRPKQLIFITSFRYPTQYAHPVWGLQMARAWTSLMGRSFAFVISDTRSASLLDGISYISAFARTSTLLQKLHLRTVAYSLWLPVFFIRRRCFGRRNIVFANDPQLATVAIFYKQLFRYRLVFESHGEYTPAKRKFFYGRADRIIFISKQLQGLALKEDPAYTAKSTVVLNGVAVDHFTHDAQSISAARGKLGIVFDGKLIGYMGRFLPGGVDKGVAFMIRALAKLPAQYRMLFVGGIEQEITEMETLARSVGVSDRVMFHSFVPTEEVPTYAYACDILAYVPETIGFMQRETVPMKLLEYMAARRPVVVSDTPSVRELVDESCADLCEAGSLLSFSSAIERAASAPTSSVERAFERVKRHTWLARAQQILDFSTN